MRRITILLVLFALVLTGVASKAPAQAVTKSATADLESQLLKELAKYEYKAKKDVPAADYLFIEKGRLQEAMYKSALQTGGVLVKAGAVTKVSSVKIMDRGVQIFFETDKCAMINMAAENDDLAKMSLPKLVEFSKTSIAALFHIVGEEKAGSGEAKAPEVKEKPAAKEETKEEKKKP